MTGGVAPGWYPDYEAPPGHQRYWDGARWTERRSVASSSRRRRIPVIAAAVVLLATGGVGIGVGAFGLSGEPPSHIGRDVPPTAQSSGPAEPAEPAGSPVTPADSPHLWKVRAVVDPTTLRLSSGVRVRLAGVVDACAQIGLGKLVVGKWVSLTLAGPDKAADGRLLRYVELDGVDIGRRLIQRGWAQAGDEPNPRRAIYREIDRRTPDVCH